MECLSSLKFLIFLRVETLSCFAVPFAVYLVCGLLTPIQWTWRRMEARIWTEFDIKGIRTMLSFLSFFQITIDCMQFKQTQHTMLKQMKTTGLFSLLSYSAPIVLASYLQRTRMSKILAHRQKTIGLASSHTMKSQNVLSKSCQEPRRDFYSHHWDIPYFSEGFVAPEAPGSRAPWVQ